MTRLSTKIDIKSKLNKYPFSHFQNLILLGHMSPSYRNFAPVSVSSMSSPRRDDGGRYSSGREQEKTLLNRLQHGHLPSYLQDHHQGHQTPQLSEQLNQSSIGTHV